LFSAQGLTVTPTEYNVINTVGHHITESVAIYLKIKKGETNEHLRTTQRIYICIDILYTHIPTHTYTDINMHTHTYIYMYIHTLIHTYTYIYTYTYTYTYICIYIYIYIHTYTYIYIYI